MSLTGNTLCTWFPEGPIQFLGNKLLITQNDRIYLDKFPTQKNLCYQTETSNTKIYRF